MKKERLTVNVSTDFKYTLEMIAARDRRTLTELTVEALGEKHPELANIIRAEIREAERLESIA